MNVGGEYWDKEESIYFIVYKSAKGLCWINENNVEQIAMLIIPGS